MLPNKLIIAPITFKILLCKLVLITFSSIYIYIYIYNSDSNSFYIIYNNPRNHSWALLTDSSRILYYFHHSYFYKNWINALFMILKTRENMLFLCIKFG
jgi:hypothetical protein